MPLENKAEKSSLLASESKLMKDKCNKASINKLLDSINNEINLNTKKEYEGDLRQRLFFILNPQGHFITKTNQKNLASLIWDHFIKNNKTMNEISLFIDNSEYFTLLCKLGLGSCKKTVYFNFDGEPFIDTTLDELNLLMFFLNNIGLLENVDTNSATSLLYYCLSNKPADFIISMLQDLKITKCPDIAESVDQLLNNPVLYSKIKNNQELNYELIISRLDKQDKAMQTWSLTVAFVVCAMQGLDDESHLKSLKFLLNSATEHHIAIDKTVFLNLYKKMRSAPEKKYQWLVDLVEYHLKSPLFTLEEMISEGDSTLIFNFLNQASLEPEKKHVLSAVLESKKIPPKDKISILDKMIERGLKLDSAVLSEMIHILFDKTKNNLEELPVLEHLLSKGSITEVLKILSILAPMDIKLFANLQNDAELSGSSLQGQKNMRPVVEYLKILFSVFSNRNLPILDDEKIKAFKDLLETYEQVENIIAESQVILSKCNRYEHDSAIRTCRDDHAKKIIALMDKKSTERILLPSGWNAAHGQPGHAMLICLEKMPGGTYRLILFNTGGGLEYHKREIVGTKVKCCPMRLFEGLSRKELIDCISKTVMIQNTESFLQGVTGYTFNKEALYNAFNEFLETDSQFPLITPQRSGTCTARVFSPLERWIFKKQFSAAKYSIKACTNEYYMQQIRAKVLKGELVTAYELKQIEYSLRNFARFLVKLKEKNALPLNELESSTQKTNEDMAFIEECTEQRQASMRQESKNNLLTEIKPVNHFIAPYIDQFSDEFKDEEEKLSPTPPVLPLNFCKAPVLTQAVCLEEIKKIKSYQQHHLYQESKIMLEDFLQKTLMGNIAIDPENLEETVDIINSISELSNYYRVACTICDKDEVSSKAALFNMTALLLSYQVILKKNPGQEKNVLNSFDLNLKVKEFKTVFQQLAKDSIFFHAHSPEFYPILQTLELGLDSLNQKNVNRYQYVCEKYNGLATVMNILADEAYQNKKNSLEASLKGRAPQSWQIPEPLKEEEKYALISSFFYKQDSFRKKIASLCEINETIDAEAVFKEFEALKRDSAIASTLDTMTSWLGTLSQKTLLSDSGTLSIPFQYRDASFNSTPVQYILNQGYTSDKKRIAWDKTRETDPNKLQDLLSSSSMRKEFSKKDLAIIQRVMSTRVEEENQVFSIIEFFKNNIPLLIHTEYQVVLICFLFEPGLLPKELAANKHLKNHILSFLHDAILKHRSELSLLSSGVFLYELTSLLQEFLFDPEIKGLVNQLINKIPEELQQFEKLELDGNLTSDQLLSYSRLSKVSLLEKLKSLKLGNLSASGFEDLYLSYFKANQLALRVSLVNVVNKEIDAKISEEFAFCKLALEHQFKDEHFKNKILINILKKTLPSYSITNNFTGVFPIFHAVDSNGEPIEINLSTGKCLIKSLEPGYIPVKIRESPFFIEKFGAINPPALISSMDGSFEFNANGYDRKLITKYPMRVLTKIKDLWCQERLDTRNLPLSIRRDYLIFDSNKESFFEAKDKRDRFGLYAKLEAEGKRLLYLTEAGLPTSYRLRSTWQVEAKDESAILIKHLTNFIAREEIEIYDNTSSNADNSIPPLHIKIPAYNLHLICKKYPDPLKGKWQLFLRDKPNYRLKLDLPKLNGIEGFPHWLPFEDVSTDTKVSYGLFPVKKLNGVSIHGDLAKFKTPAFSLNKNEKQDADPILFFKIADKNNTLIPETGEGLIYLAYLQLYYGDPFSAYELLSKGQKNTALLGSAQELEWLKAIILNDGDKQVQEVLERTEYVAVKLQAIYLFIQNHLMQDPELLISELKNPMFNEIFKEAYYRYLDAIHHVPKTLVLPDTVELTLLNFIFNNDLQMGSKFQVRYQALLETRKSGQIAAPSLESKSDDSESVNRAILRSEGVFDTFLEQLNQGLETIDIQEQKDLYPSTSFHCIEDPKEVSGDNLSSLFGFPVFSFKKVEKEIESKDFVDQDLKKGALQNDSEKKFRMFCDQTLSPFLEKEKATLIETFNQDLILEKKVLDTLKHKLLEKGNSSLKLKQNQMELLGRTLEKVTMKDLIALFLKNNKQNYLKETLLPMHEAQALHQMMYQYLLKKNHYNRLKKAKKDLLNWQKDPNDKQALYDLGTLLYASRQYQPHENPDLLVLERYENILLREEQIVILKSLLEKKDKEQTHKIIQLIMGGGKSKVIAPLLMRLHASEDTLCIYRVPRSLFETSLADLKRSYSTLFGKDVIPFKFSRIEPYSAAFLKNLLDQFKECMHEKNCVLSMGNAMRSLGLKYYDLLALLTKEPENHELWEQLKWVEELLLLINKNAYVLIDEADSELNIEEELNYPFGPEEGLELEWNSAILDLHELLDAELQAKQEQPLKKLPKLILEQKSGILNTILQPLHLTSAAKKIIKHYLENSLDKPVHAFIEKLPNEVKDILAIYRYEIHQALPVTLQKRVDEHFGKSKRVKETWSPVDEIPIPYVASQTPKEGSRFVNIYTAINNTIRLQKLKGISLPAFAKMIERFQNAAEEEFATQKSRDMLTISDTPAAKEFNKITGLSILLRDISQNNKPQLENLLQGIAKKTSVIRYVLEKIILPEVKTHKDMLNMNAIQEIDLYGHVDVMSGTLANWRTLHQDLKLDEKNSVGIDGKTIDLLLTKDINYLPCSGNTAEMLVTSFFSLDYTGRGFLHAIIDVGALFNDFTNEEVSTAISRKLSTIPGNQIDYVLFYNKANILCAKSVNNPIEPIKELGTSNPIVLKELLGCGPDKCFTFYDQNHTRGTDIKQDPYARAVMSVNKKTELKDVLQGVMRMRQFAQSQEIDVILPLETYNSLGKKNMEGIIALARKNQEETLARQHYISALKKIKEVFKKNLDQHLKNRTLTRSEKLNYYDAFSDFFVNTFALHPFEQLGGLEISENMVEHLNNYTHTLEKSWRTALEKVKITISKAEADTMKTAYSTIIDTMKPFLPERVSMQTCLNRSNTNAEMQSEKQEIKQQQTQQQQLQEQEQHTDDLVSHFSKTVTHTAWNDETWNAWCADKESPHFNNVTSHLKGEATSLGLSKDLRVSSNFLDTFDELRTLHYKAKKPLDYVVMRYFKGEVKTQIITQIEANELSNCIKNRDMKEEPIIWIQTVNGSLYAGDFPKEYPQNMPDEYNNILEQLHFLNGDIEVLAEHFDKNTWFLPESYLEKMSYFKMHIAPDEALNAQNLSTVENKLLKKFARPMEAKQNTDEKEEQPRMETQASYHSMNRNKIFTQSTPKFLSKLKVQTPEEDNSGVEETPEQPSP